MHAAPPPAQRQRGRVTSHTHARTLGLGARVHVRTADRQGNVSCGYASENVILAQASKTVIVTAEEIVERVTEKEAVGTWMHSIDVDVVVHAPRGAHPAGMPGVYDVDRGHMAEYVEASKTEEGFAAYLQKYVHDVTSHSEYVERYVRDARPTARDAADD